MTIFWKRFAGLGTDFVYSYQTNIFFRTSIRVIFSLLFSVGVTLLILSYGVGSIFEKVQKELIKGIHSATGVREATILREINEAITTISFSDIFLLFCVLIVTIIFFGFLISRIALKPTRDSLASQKLFIGNIAHELRTPLAIVKTNIEVALLDAQIDHDLRRVLEDNIEELDRSSDIINNLLSLNTLLNPSTITFGNVDFGTCTDEAIEKLLPLSTQRNITLSITKKEFLLVRGNRTALLQVAINLIKNAITHTGPSGSVRVSLQPDYRGYIELRITDNGVGIPQKDLLHIFEPFYQADRSRTKSLGGSGLGLTIVSEIVKLHGGKIVIQSNTKRGTTVIISIPCGITESDTSSEIPEGTGKIAMDYSRKKQPTARK